MGQILFQSLQLLCLFFAQFFGVEGSKVIDNFFTIFCELLDFFKVRQYKDLLHRGDIVTNLFSKKSEQTSSDFAIRLSNSFKKHRIIRKRGGSLIIIRLQLDNLIPDIDKSKQVYSE